MVAGVRVGVWAEDAPCPSGVLARYPRLCETPLADPAQRIQVCDQRAASGRDDRRALAEYQVAGEARAIEDEAHVVLCVSRRRDDSERAGVRAAVGPQHGSFEPLGAGSSYATCVTQASPSF